MPKIHLFTEDDELASIMASVCREQGWDFDVSFQPPGEASPSRHVDLAVIDVRASSNMFVTGVIAVQVVVDRQFPLTADRAIALGPYTDLVGRMNAFVVSSSGYVRIHPLGAPPAADFAERITESLSETLQLPVYVPIDFHVAYPDREFYRAMFECMQWPVVVLSPDERIVMMNLRALAQFDYPTHMVIGEHWSMLVAGAGRESSAKNVVDGCTSTFYHETQLRMVDRHGREFPALIASSRLFHSDHSGRESNHLILGIYDMSTVEALQQHLATYQRMESVERVVSGMAHEFNNLLTGIFGHAALLTEDLVKGTSAYDSAAVIRRECERARELTSRLLGLSSSRQFVPGPVSCNDLVSSTQRLMKHSMGKGIRLKTEILCDADIVEGDIGQLQQVLINLCINARDALKGKGLVTLRTSVCQVFPEDCNKQPDLVPGMYVEMSVTDDGSGMSQGVLEHVQEPFYTTKRSGEGMGLGLSIVSGIVRSHGGFMMIESAVGKGTTVRVIIPRSEDQTLPEVIADDDDEVLSSEEVVTGAILVVDDEQSVLTYAQKTLEKKGFQVFPALKATQALEVLQQHREELSLVIMDLTMAGMSGRDLLMRIRETGDEIPIIVATGFAAGGIDDAMIEQVQGFIKKPYSPDDLLELVREVLASVDE